jgi:chlorobactene glucosyltransferase
VAGLRVLALVLIAWGLLIVLITTIVIWVILYIRVKRMVRDDPVIRRGLDLPPPEAGWPRVSIIVPAHNEQRVIDACLQSLRGQQYDALEIILVLDRCTDDTLAIAQRHAAEDSRVKIIENDHCPPDWAGKCNAAKIGAQHATGRWLLFTDADTAFDPHLVRASVAMAAAHGASLLSLLSSLTQHTWFERIVQPVASMQLGRMYPVDRVNSPSETYTRPFANGQFMLFDRAAYEAIGGHDAVKDDLLEDIAFAGCIARSGRQGKVYFADGMLRCSMYDTYAAFQEGWKRIFMEAGRRKPARLRKYGLRVMGGGLVPPLAQIGSIALSIVLMTSNEALLGGILLTLALVSAGMQFGLLVWVYRICGTSGRYAVTFPIGSWLVYRIMAKGAYDLEHRRPIRWAGKEYVIEPRM